MKMTYLCRVAILGFVMIALPVALKAQEASKVRLSGSFETNSIYYVPDEFRQGIGTPDDRFGSNNYLKLDYAIGKFTAGIQMELYAPVLYGYDAALKGARITNKFAGWSDGRFAVTVGDFYEQYGSGLILRAYEDRALGFNNALEGVRASYEFGDYLTVRALWARPRIYMNYAPAWVRGADASFVLSSALGMDSYLAIEGSYVNRYDQEKKPDDPVGANLDAWSARLAFEAGGFSMRAEWVQKGDDAYVDNLGKYKTTKGNAQLVELSYNNKGLGVLATFRRLSQMDMKITDSSVSEGNAFNYMPSLTRQHSYMLATLRPHAALTGGMLDGEQGGQIDVFYNFRRGTVIGGKYGMKVHVNGALFYPVGKFGSKRNLLYSDFNFDITRQWNRKLKTTLFMSIQGYNPSKGLTNALYMSNIFVADVLYKFTNKISLRVEAEYLYSAESTKDWVGGSVELSFAPQWSIFAGDMYNHGSERVHYYNAGFSFSHSRTRVALSYGRNRAGIVCSGGVCRETPAYTGANLSITTSF